SRLRRLHAGHRGEHAARAHGRGSGRHHGPPPLRGALTMKTDWFELRDARLHPAPYSDPCFPIPVASVITPAGMISAGKHGLGVLSLGAGLPGGPEAIAEHWRIGEETAAKHGTTMDRGKWRLVVNCHVADDDELALRQIHAGERHETVTYFEETLG